MKTFVTITNAENTYKAKTEIKEHIILVNIFKNSEKKCCTRVTFIKDTSPLSIQSWATEKIGTFIK